MLPVSQHLALIHNILGGEDLVFEGGLGIGEGAGKVLLAFVVRETHQLFIFGNRVARRALLDVHEHLQHRLGARLLYCLAQIHKTGNCDDIVVLVFIG